MLKGVERNLYGALGWESDGRCGACSVDVGDGRGGGGSWLPDFEVVFMLQSPRHPLVQCCSDACYVLRKGTQ